jgi:hypothetical protein
MGWADGAALPDRTDPASRGLTREVMLRPLKAVTLFAERMGEEFGKALARNGMAASEGR